MFAQVLRFQIPGTDPGFAEAFEDHFGRPYDEEEAEAVYSQVGEGQFTADFTMFVPSWLGLGPTVRPVGIQHDPH